MGWRRGKAVREEALNGVALAGFDGASDMLAVIMRGTCILEAENVYVMSSEEGKDGCELVFGVNDKAAGVEGGKGKVA